MKTVIRKSLVLITLLLAVTVSYGNEISGNRNNEKNVATNVTFKDVKKGSVLSIKDTNGLTLYKEAIQVNGNYSKGFDLTSLPNGNYYFEMDKDVELKVIPFKVVASVVTFDKISEVKIFKPVVLVKNSTVYVSKMATSDDESLSVEIVSENGDSVYSSTIKKQGNSLGQIYDFSTSDKGSYSIIMKTEGRRFVENIQI